MKLPVLGRPGAGGPRPRWFIYLLFLLFSSIPLWGSLSYYLQVTGHYYSVYVNGLEIGLISREEVLEEMLATLAEEASDFYGKPVVMVEKVILQEVHLPFAEPDEEKVLSNLRHLLSYKVKARMVTVDGRDVLPVGTEEEVEEIIRLIAGAYIPQKDNVSLEKVQLSENISSRPYYCYPEEIYAAETVASVLLRGTDRREIYLVSRGDSLWKIAREHNLTVEELKEANPQLEGDLIRVGDEISLIVPEPMVNVITVERMVVEEKIPFQTNYVYDNNMWRTQTRVVEQGSFGLKEVVYQVTRENGIEVEREKLSENIIQEPTPQVIAKGTASIPSRGTGSFIWPVQGGGRITSGYGWRSGNFHAGIDIAAPKGTPVLAADSGVVVFEGWDGGYGRSIVIYHGYYYTRYAHNSENLVKVGQAVNKGQVIARVGSTGRSFGPHLHFEIRTGSMHGSTLNPLNFFKP